MAQVVNISAKWLRSLPSPVSGRVWYSDESLSHFQLCATHTGARIYYRVGRVGGKMSRVRIGAYPAIPPNIARDLCTQINADVAMGRDVVRTRRTATSKKTLGAAYEWWLEYHAKPHKRTWARDVRVWERDVSHMAGRALDDVKRSEVIELVAQKAKQFGPGAGNRIIELIGGIYSIAMQNEWTARNPAYKIPKHKHADRERFLLPHEVPAFFEALQSFRPRIRDFFLLCLYTGARRSNVMAMRWDEINLDAWSWTVPHDKSKNKRAMVLPLVIPAIEIITRRKETAGDNPWVFPSKASKSGHYTEPKDAWKRIITKAGIADLTIHDLRRTLGSWQAAQGVPIPMIAKSLGHKPGSSATHIYARIANDPVLLAVMNATDALQAASEKKSEKS